MFKINGTTISLTRGDTFLAKITMKRNGEDYTPAEGDVVRFAMTTSPINPSRQPIITKVIPNDTLVLRLEPADTKQLRFGNYSYDIQITFANGDVDTFIDNATLILTPEVE